MRLVIYYSSYYFSLDCSKLSSPPLFSLFFYQYTPVAKDIFFNYILITNLPSGYSVMPSTQSATGPATQKPSTNLPLLFSELASEELIKSSTEPATEQLSESSTEPPSTSKTKCKLSPFQVHLNHLLQSGAFSNEKFLRAPRHGMGKMLQR